jgi:hypothetical protein
MSVRIPLNWKDCTDGSGSAAQTARIMPVALAAHTFHCAHRLAQGGLVVLVLLRHIIEILSKLLVLLWHRPSSLEKRPVIFNRAALPKCRVPLD